MDGGGAWGDTRTFLVARTTRSELSAHLVGAVSNRFMAENIFGGNLADLGVVSEPVEISDATITMGRKPGHGIEFDRARLPAFAIEGTGPIRREPANHAGL